MAGLTELPDGATAAVDHRVRPLARRACGTTRRGRCWPSLLAELGFVVSDVVVVPDEVDAIAAAVVPLPRRTTSS